MKQKLNKNQKPTFTKGVLILVLALLNMMNSINIANFINQKFEFTSDTAPIFQSPPDSLPVDINKPQATPVQTFISQLLRDPLNLETIPLEPNQQTVTDPTTVIIPKTPTTPSTSGTGTKKPNNDNNDQDDQINDCTPTQILNQNINIYCSQGYRRYNTSLLTFNNTNPSQSCKLNLQLNNSNGPAITNNFTTGNADLYFIVSSVQPSDLTFDLLPAPEAIGSWTQWQNQTLQLELVNGNLQPANTSQTFTIPPNSQRNLGLIVDCGSDTQIGENAIIKLQSTYSN
jgi:hypothetical protein